MSVKGAYTFLYYIFHKMQLNLCFMDIKAMNEVFYELNKQLNHKCFHTSIWLLEQRNEDLFSLSTFMNFIYLWQRYAILKKKTDVFLQAIFIINTKLIFIKLSLRIFLHRYIKVLFSDILMQKHFLKQKHIKYF